MSDGTTTQPAPERRDAVNECDLCGLAACDLPDGVDPEAIFDGYDGETLCAGCALQRGLL